MIRSVISTLTALPLLTILPGCTFGPDAEVVTEIPWALTSPALVIDTHTHTRFSDGRLTVDELVEKAAANGCDAMAITDHSDQSERAASPAYFDAIDAARAKHPGMVLFAGLEWNIPPYDGREHVTLLLAPALERQLEQFKATYESADDPRAPLEWLSARAASRRSGVLFYNHPSRKDDALRENLQDYLSWRGVTPLLAGFEGAPGHQNREAVGSYTERFTTEDRWDPVVAEVGGVWDLLLDQGADVWAALAGSDYHNEGMDHPPCSFSRTHVTPEDPSHEGIIAGLRAGSFWADHGAILDQLLFTLSTEGLVLPITPGERARIDGDAQIALNLSITRGEGALQEELVVELIGNGRSGKPELLSTQRLAAGEEMTSWRFDNLVPGGDGSSAYYRVRVRKQQADAPDLLAYSNPIRVEIR